MNIHPTVAAKLQLWQPRPYGQWPAWYVWTGGWYENDGEATYYVAWDDLPAGGIVWDVGGYEGNWTKRMAEKYPTCTFHLFEPAPRAFGVAKDRLAALTNVHLHPYGLGTAGGTFPLYDCNRDSATFLPGGKPGTPDGAAAAEAQIVPFWRAMLAERVDRIDLMSLNIEGGEFALLSYLVASGLIRRIERLMIQWHSVVDNALATQETIQEAMAETHAMAWNLGAWEAWRVKPSVSSVGRSTACTPDTF